MAADDQTQLDWERRLRPRAAAAAVAAGLLPLLAGIANAVVYNGAPRSSLLTSLERAFQDGPVGSLQTLHLPLYEFYRDNFAILLLIAAVNAVGVLAAGAVLTFLGRAAQARRPEFRSIWVRLPMVAGALLALAGIVLVVGTNVAVGSLLDGPRTVSAVSDLGGGLLTVGKWLEGSARLLLGVGFVLVCLNAMRVGLLTRFMGALGIIAGALLVLPIGGPLPIVQAFWLTALAISIGNRWPGAVPPAWTTGRAEPWPSQQQVREAKQKSAAASERSGRGRSDDGVADDAVAAGDEHGAAETAAVPARGPRTTTGKRKRKGRG